MGLEQGTAENLPLTGKHEKQVLLADTWPSPVAPSPHPNCHPSEFENTFFWVLRGGMCQVHLESLWDLVMMLTGIKKKKMPLTSDSAILL